MVDVSESGCFSSSVVVFAPATADTTNCKVFVFTSLANLRMNLMDYVHDELPTPSFKLGYYEAPHNMKHWLMEQRDLQAMYKSFSVSARITLW